MRAGLGLSLLSADDLSAEAAEPPPVTPDEGLRRLLAGNERFADDRSECRALSARRVELAQGQSPFAIVLSCSDSRVPVETVFDQMPGNIFSVRVAGNFLTGDGLGSIEYSIAVLQSTLILVLGHTSCGAVKAAVEYVKDGAKQPGSIQRLVDAVAPAAKAAKPMPGDWPHNATVRNVEDNVAALPAQSSIVAGAVKSGKLGIFGGVYDLHSGKVTIIR